MRRAFQSMIMAVFIATMIALPTQDAMAQVAPATMNEMGTVVSKTDGELVVRTDAGIEMRFEIDSDATVPMVTPGDRVNVSYHSEADGNYHADVVTLPTGAPVPGTPAADTYGSTTGSTSTGSTPRDRYGESLPATAGPIPMLALLGVILAGAAAGARMISRRRERSRMNGMGSERMGSGPMGSGPKTME